MSSRGTFFGRLGGDTAWRKLPPTEAEPTRSSATQFMARLHHAARKAATLDSSVFALHADVDRQMDEEPGYP